MKQLHGYHCSRFDTSLLQQVIATDVDTAVRRLQREKGVIIDPATEREWIDGVLQIVEKAMLADRDTHSLLPSVMEERIKAAISKLTDDSASTIADEPLSFAQRGVRPFRRMCTALIAYRRCLCDKRLE